VFNRCVKALATGVLVAVVGGCGSVGASSGGGMTGGGGGVAGGMDENGNSCFFEFNPPDTGIIAGASVKGTVMTKCKTPPRQHDLTLKLQRDVNGVWTDQNTKVISRIPTEDAYPNIISAPCVPGSWRVVVSIVVVSATGIHRDVPETFGIEQEVRPHDCA